jgi:hypothetical protein
VIAAQPTASVGSLCPHSPSFVSCYGASPPIPDLCQCNRACVLAEEASKQVPLLTESTKPTLALIHPSCAHQPVLESVPLSTPLSPSNCQLAHQSKAGCLAHLLVLAQDPDL